MGRTNRRTAGRKRASAGPSRTPVITLTSRAVGSADVSRMLAAGSLVISATAIRVGICWIGLSATRTPSLVRLAVRASLGGREAGRARAEFRDDFLALARNGAEVSWLEMRRGLDELEELTRPNGHEQPLYRRRHRVKR